MSEVLYDVIDKVVENTEADFLNKVSLDIWKNPELKFEEVRAHDILTTALEDKGFAVQKHYLLPTAFRGEYSCGEPGPTVAVICEYDALPQIGHACGHNLIAEAGLGAGIALKSVIETSKVPGKVVVLGTPAEEGGGGKILLIKKGAFKDIDVALMVHPGPSDHLYPPFIALQKKTITFTGREAHASGFPWQGLNALDAAVACYNNIALLRQHIKPTHRIHAIISKGGEVPSIIPGHTEIQLYYRGPTSRDMSNLDKRIEFCVQAAATATGCEFSSVNDADVVYKSLMTNSILAERYRKYAEQLGVHFDDGDPKKIAFMASSDMGDVSHVVPSIHPTYSIGTRAANHSSEFTAASGTMEAHRTTLITAKAMAKLGVDVLCDEAFFKEVKRQFQVDAAEDLGL